MVDSFLGVRGKGFPIYFCLLTPAGFGIKEQGGEIYIWINLELVSLGEDGS